MISFLPGVNASASALEAERARLDVISQNIAHANTTRGLDGKPYQRQTVVFESMLRNAADGSIGIPEVRVSGILKDARPPRLIFNPGHPDADREGMVAMPNVNIHEEMADMIVASRAFEANLAVIKNSRMLALQALSIGKR
ncbi:MAG TPA: flagellar basal body rod protein FlgC [Candidatus Limnocylindria bacterium]|nr:flagellar basal body rod protein FlgC [Candidatus Limnocylindria bacterium]